MAYLVQQIHAFSYHCGYLIQVRRPDVKLFCIHKVPSTEPCGMSKRRSVRMWISHRPCHYAAVLVLSSGFLHVVLHGCHCIRCILCHLYLALGCQKNCAAFHRLQRHPARRNVQTWSVPRLCTNELPSSKWLWGCPLKAFSHAHITAWQVRQIGKFDSAENAQYCKPLYVVTKKVGLLC